jgi:hypothetical protein
MTRVIREVVKKGRILPLTREESELVRQHGLSEGQIAWRRKQWKTMRGLAVQEYAEDSSSCFLVSGESVFERAAIEKAAGLAGEPTESQDNGRLTIWFPPQKGRQYILGVDTAGGGSEGDYACAQVIERVMGMQCAELHGHFPPYELARRVADLGQRYEQALVAVERNNHGYGVLAHLNNLEYGNLFEKDGQAGWLTSAASRPAMIENMAGVLMSEPALFHSPRLLEECTHTLGGSGPTRAADAGRGAGALDALLGWNFYVVKFRNNPQHLRVLANEMLATRLAERAGLPVPGTEVVEVDEWLVEHTPELSIQLAHNTIRARRDYNLDRGMW